MESFGVTMKGSAFADNLEANDPKNERHDLSTLLEVGSPLEVLKRSIYYWELNESLEFASWKLNKKIKETRNKNIDKKTKLTLSQWNAWSVSTDTKIQFIQSLPSDIIAVQETWRQSENLQKIGEIIELCEREQGRGGGSATLKLSDLEVQIKQRFMIGKDSHAIKLQFENTYMWVVNVYLSEGSIEQIQELFGELRNSIPENELDILCCIGDFNVDLNKESHERKLLEKLCKFLNLNIVRPSEHTTKHGSILDYIIIGKNIGAYEQSIVYGPSDHRALNWELEITNIQKRKAIKIPCKTTANSISQQLLENDAVVDASSFIHMLGKLKQKNKRYLWKKIRPKAFKNDSLMKLLLELQDPQKTEKTINEYWINLWRGTESQRYSVNSAHAYQTLRKILKYHLFEKRDGGIINCIKNEDGSIENNFEKVHELLAETMKEIQIDKQWDFLVEKEFPKLNRLDEEEMISIISNLASGKAIAYDGVSDIIFSEKNPRNDMSSDEEGEGEEVSTNMELTAKKLRNLWRVPLHKYDDFQDSWDTRLIPLNKVFPNIPTRKELRPIAVQSPIVKLLEARFLPKLQNYLNTKLDRSQTGFIQKIGIQVNLVRAMERITLRTSQKKYVYGLFIDFSNAYNSIPHSLLFQKLRNKKVLSDDEIDYLEQLYARYRLRIGKTRIRSNKGVAQGSVISPALFNIFIEDLSEELKDKTDINLEDLLYYADDLLALCTSMEQVKKVIKVISDWSLRNGMQLNKKKSGIVIFAARKRHDIPNMLQTIKTNKGKGKSQKMKFIPARNTIEGVPICEKYKYLGTILTPKLESSEQISYIKRKAGFLYVKLYPYLKNASADARRDMWQTMVKPLFNAALVLLEYEPSDTQKEILERVWRGTFKQFMMINSKTPNDLVTEMINSDLQLTASTLVKECKSQWSQRKNYQKVDPKIKPERKENLLRGVSNRWCDIINFQTNWCFKCYPLKEICCSSHLKHAHGIIITDVFKIWKDDICPTTRRAEKKSRDKLELKLQLVLNKYVMEMEKAKAILAQHSKKK